MRFWSWPKSLQLSSKLQKCNPLLKGLKIKPSTGPDFYQNIISCFMILARHGTFITRWPSIWSFVKSYIQVWFFSSSPSLSCCCGGNFNCFQLQFITHAHRALCLISSNQFCFGFRVFGLNLNLRFNFKSNLFILPWLVQFIFLLSRRRLIQVSAPIQVKVQFSPVFALLSSLPWVCIYIPKLF